MIKKVAEAAESVTDAVTSLEEVALLASWLRIAETQDEYEDAKRQLALAESKLAHALRN